MSVWGTNGNANRIKDTYIKGFLDVSGGTVIVEKSSSLRIMSHDSDHPVLEFKPEYFTVNTTSAVDVSYSALAALGVLGVSFEQSTVDITNRIKYITSGTIGAPPNQTFYTDIGNDDENCDLQVYGLIKSHHGLVVDGDVSFNDNFFVAGDSSFNGNLSVARDLSLNGNLYIGKQAFFLSDVSLNSKLYVGGDVSLNSRLTVSGDVSLNSKLFVGGDVSFNSKLFVSGDVSLNSKLFVGGDVSLNSKLFVGGDVSLNSKLFVSGDVSFNSKLFVGGDVSLNSKLIVGGDVSLNSKLFVSGDVSLNSKLIVGGDVSLNSKLFVARDVSMNSKLIVGDDVSLNSKLFVARDVSMNSKLIVGLFVARDVSLNSKLIVGDDVSFNSKLFVARDVSLNSKLIVGDDVSFNSRLFVARDVSVNGNLFVANRSVFTLDVSMNGNLDIGSGSSSVAINKDISSAFALDVSGVMRIYEGVGSGASFTTGSLVLEHGSLSKPSSLVFKSSKTSNDYAYVQYEDNVTTPLSVYKWNLSSGSPSTISSGIVETSIGTNTSLDATVNPYAYWYYIANFSNNQGTLGCIDFFIRGSDRRLFLLINADSTNFKWSNTTIENNTWTHIAFTFSSTLNNGFIYINGVKTEIQEGNGFSGKTINTFNSLGISVRYGRLTGSNYSKGFRGYMNYINVFNSLLSDSDIAYLYNNPGDRGLVTFGIENGGSLTNDRIALWPNSGQGFVGINTKTPNATLDVSGRTIIRSNLDVSGNINDITVGRGAGNYSTNTAVGFQALATSGPTDSVAVGYQALNKANTTANNDAFGYQALINCTSGGNNTAIGYNTLNRITTAFHNTAIGRNAGNGDAGNAYIFQGSNNTFLGSYTGMTGAYNNSTAVGSEAIITASNQIRLGTDSQTVVCGSLNVNSKLTITNDVSFNSKLFVSGDVSMNSKLIVGGDVSLNSRLFVSNDVSLNSRLFVSNDVSLNSKLFVSGDVSLNSKLFVSGDVSLNSRLFVSGDVSLNSKLTVTNDVSLNSKLFVAQDVSLNGNLFVANRSVFTLDVSMNGNLDIGSGSSSVAINKDISSAWSNAHL